MLFVGGVIDSICFFVGEFGLVRKWMGVGGDDIICLVDCCECYWFWLLMVVWCFYLGCIVDRIDCGMGVVEFVYVIRCSYWCSGGIYYFLFFVLDSWNGFV